MDKDIGKIKKNDETDIIVRVDDYKGKKGVTVREFITSEKYTGFTKAGTRIPAEKFLEFREIINSVNLSELTSPAEASKSKDFDGAQKPLVSDKNKKSKKEVQEEISEEEII